MRRAVFKHIHKWGWATLYPEIFGVESYTESTLGKEAASLQCVQPGWSNPLMKDGCSAARAKGNPVLSPVASATDCQSADCDLPEFMYEVTMGILAADVPTETIWSPYLPRDPTALKNILSAEFPVYLSAADYGIPTAHPSGKFEV